MPGDSQQARELFEQAITFDPENAPAYAWLEGGHFRICFYARSPSHENSSLMIYDFDCENSCPE